MPGLRQYSFFILVLAFSLLPSTAVSAKRYIIPANEIQAGSVIFSLPNVNASHLRQAKLQIGNRHKKLSLWRVQQAIANGRLPIYPAQRVLIKLKKHTIAPLKLILITGTRVTTPYINKLSSFENNDWSDLDGNSFLSGSLSLNSQRTYDGRYAAQAQYNGSGSNGFARSWFEVNLKNGSQVWYGGAYYLPSRTSRACWYSILRWDNYRLFQSAGDVGGIEVTANGRARLMRANYNGENYAALGKDFTLPRERWFWLEVHQRLSNHNQRALSQVYLDGKLVSQSRKGNSRGRAITEIRHGLVALAPECTPAMSFFFDQVSVASHMRGPLKN